MRHFFVGFALLLAAEAASAACVAASLPSVTTFDAQVSSDDCAGTNGTHFDAYTFQGREGAYIEVTLAPLEPGLATPYVALRAPRGDSSAQPFVGGAGTLRFRCVL